MSSAGEQNEFGYFGKLPTLGDFIHQVLPLDFVNNWHEWLQVSMAAARTALGDEFLRYYLNCPAWKFLMAPGICGAQAAVGLTIPSVDKVGRYFNFTLATMLPPTADPCAYVLDNQEGMVALENVALDLLESDYPSEEVELRVRALSLQFSMVSPVKHKIETTADHIRISQNQALTFAGPASALLSHLITRDLGNFSLWWHGQQGQSRSTLVACAGMPPEDVYLQFLTLGEPPAVENEEINYIDKIISGEV